MPLPAPLPTGSSLNRALSIAASAYFENTLSVRRPVYSRPDDHDGPLMVLPDSGMLLHASRLAVPREKKEGIDVTAPLPERFGRWLDLYDGE